MDAWEPVHAGKIPLNDVMPASGLDSGAAPDWRSVAPSTARLSFSTPQFSCTHNERAWFLYLAYSAGQRPGTGARRFAEAYANGALVPYIAELGQPKNRRRLIRPADRALFSFMLEIETSKRAYARGRMPTACRSARSCAVSWSTMSGESKLGDPRHLSLLPRLNRRTRREIEPLERMRPARFASRGLHVVPNNAPDQSAMTGSEGQPS